MGKKDEICEKCHRKINFDHVFLIYLCQCPKKLRFVRPLRISTETTEEDWGNPIAY